MIIIRCTDLDREALAGIEIDHAQIADDGSDYSRLPVWKPWGYEVERYRDQNIAVWSLRINAEHHTSMHCHPNKKTLLMIVQGDAVLSTLNGSFELREYDIAVIEKGAFHRTASGKAPVLLYELETPPNKRNLVRLHDTYGRGQGYERI